MSPVFDRGAVIWALASVACGGARNLEYCRSMRLPPVMLGHGVDTSFPETTLLAIAIWWKCCDTVSKRNLLFRTEMCKFSWKEPGLDWPKLWWIFLSAQNLNVFILLSCSNWKSHKLWSESGYWFTKEILLLAKVHIDTVQGNPAHWEDYKNVHAQTHIYISLPLYVEAYI